MDYIKKHKLTAFIILVFIVIVCFGYFVYNMFIGSSGMPVYGDRLDGIENVPITEEQYTKIMEELNKESIVVSVTKPYLSGRILKVIITVGDKAELKASKALTAKIVSQLTEEQKQFYDIEVFVTKEYHCTLKATGPMDEDGNFTSNVIVKYAKDLASNNNVLDFGMSDKDKVDYNKQQEYQITKDGTYIIYGYTKDKLGETKCSIKVVMKTSENAVAEETINSSTEQNFPIIGYQKKATNSFTWTKDR